MTEDSTVAIFEKSGHMTMNEEPEQYISTLSKFLNKQEFSD
jgi:pimeloyl-ACP methyl ester carboxylesterase